jgi:hypothetical protein
MENFKKFIEDHKLLDTHIRETIARFSKDFPKEYARVDLWTVSDDKITIAYSWGLEGMDIAYREFPMEFFIDYEAAAAKRKEEEKRKQDIAAEINRKKLAEQKAEMEAFELKQYERLKAKFET